MKYIWLAAILVLILPIVTANPGVPNTYTEGKYTIITGQYMPDPAGRENIPDGTKVYIYCKDGNTGKTEMISSAMNRLTSLGLYKRMVKKEVCGPGDQVKACLYNYLKDDQLECTGWVAINVTKNDDASNINGATAARDHLKTKLPTRQNINIATTAGQFIAVPEYNALTAGLLAICTIGAIAVLRGGRHK